MSVAVPRARVEHRTALIGYTLAGLLLAGLAYACLLQVGYGRAFARIAQIQQRDSIIPLPSRGRILDVRGRALALNHSSFLVQVYPTLLAADAKCTTRYIAAHRLADNCGLDYRGVVRRLETMPGMFTLVPNLNYDQGIRLKTAIRKARVDNAVSVDPLNLRVYPLGDTLGSILGFAQDNQGKAGLEQVLNPVLKGIPGKIVVQKDAMGNLYRYPDFPEVPPVPGADVSLTIDADVQRIAFEELKLCVDLFHADGGSVLVLDCRTGEIKAIGDYPYRDPRRSWAPLEPSYICRAAEASYEPGSVFKPVIGLAALDAPNADQIRARVFDVSTGSIQVGKWTIKDVHSCGVQDFAGIFIKSSNVGLTMLSQMVSRRLFYDKMRKLGFGKLSGIELPHEDSGCVDQGYRLAPDKLADVRVANNSFGQGVQVSLLQLADAYTAIANDGLCKRPFLVREVRLGDSLIYAAEPLTVRRAASAEAARQMKDILRRVMTEGTGTVANSPYFEICGKTGTAQKLLPWGGYSQDQCVATFVGFFPKDNPQYTVAISVDNPRIGRFAGTIVGPTFRRICERCYALIPIDANPQNETADAGMSRKIGVADER